MMNCCICSLLTRKQYFWKVYNDTKKQCRSYTPDKQSVLKLKANSN